MATGVYICSTCIWKCLLQNGKPLTKHMLTYDLLDPYEQISVKCLIHILVMQWPSFRRCYFQMYPISLKLWCLRFESWMTFLPRATIFYKSTLVWKMACHRFSDKPLSKRVLASPLPLKMTCVWRRPFRPCQKFNQNTTTNISHNINLFQTQNIKQYWQKRSGKGRNMIPIRAQLNREKILLIADRAQIDRLLVSWRAWQERVGRD